MGLLRSGFGLFPERFGHVGLSLVDHVGLQLR
jgi:hypothetical protein